MNDRALHNEQPNPLIEVVIFGLNDYAALAYHYFRTDPHYKDKYKVVAFTVTKEFMPSSEEMESADLPIYAFEGIDTVFDPSKVLLFAPLRSNKARENIYMRGRAMGYNFVSYVSSRAFVDTRFIGENCFILEDNVLQFGSSVNSNCVLWSGNHIGHDSQIASCTTLTSHVVISGHVKVGYNCTFGVNSTVRDGINICDNVVIGQGANVTKTIDEEGVYLGNPAKKR